MRLPSHSIGKETCNVNHDQFIPFDGISNPPNPWKKPRRSCHGRDDDLQGERNSYQKMILPLIGRSLQMKRGLTVLAPPPEARRLTGDKRAFLVSGKGCSPFLVLSGDCRVFARELYCSQLVGIEFSSIKFQPLLPSFRARPTRESWAVRSDTGEPIRRRFRLLQYVAEQLKATNSTITHMRRINV